MDQSASLKTGVSIAATILLMLIFKTVILPFLDHIPEFNFSESSLIPLACIQHARRLSL